jgi:hypothetical protein
MALLDDEETGAAFGFFPQMQPRRRLQDIQGSANLPVDVTRGRLAGLLGLIPDVLNFMGRSPMPTETFGETQYNPRPQLPYDTDFYLKNLPLAPTSRAGQVAGQAASFVPLNPAPLVRAGVAGAQALAPTAARMTERYMQRQGFMPGVVPEPPSGLLTPEIPAPKPQAPVSDLGFYSAAEQAAMNLQRGKGTGQSFLNDLMKASDVKKDELQYTGLDEFLKDKPNVTRQEVQDYIAGNRVDVQEVKLSGKADSARPFVEWSPSEQNYLVYADDEVPLGTFNTSREAEKYISDNFGKPTQYGKYQLPGGENYREILLTLPKQSPTTNDIANKLFGKEMRFLSEAEIDAVVGEARRIESTTPKDFASSHFSEPNILAHMRVNDRVDADGKKMLLIEEVQSDWHQAGREKGYNTPEKRAAEQKKLNDLLVERQQLGERQKQLEELASPYTSQGKDAPRDILDEWNSVSNRLNRLQTEQNRLGRSTGEGVPDAPFKDTWHQLALKRALKEAVDKGYDRIGLTTGKQQAERYDLSKQISKVYYSPPDSKQANKYGTVFKAFDSRGNEIINKSVTPEELPDIVGKEVAKKLLDAESNSMGVKALEGVDLQVGGEGMKKYYDEIYPAFLNKQGKKYGAKVGETRIKTGRGVPGGETVRYLDITPEMRKAVQKGQPLFTAAPIGGIGTGLLSDEQRKELSGLLGP